MEKLKKALLCILIITLLWCAISGIIQAFLCPSMTQTQLFLHIPKSFMGDWQHCD
jgi:capsular polysaccharide biosynthesis protein